LWFKIPFFNVKGNYKNNAAGSRFYFQPQIFVISQRRKRSSGRPLGMPVNKSQIQTLAVSGCIGKLPWLFFWPCSAPEATCRQEWL
ncbi:MAG: hypothetical protein NT118_02630, partial [Lentisphaerae bacterium]|nr:hypothetical protein [Lentisphaerota bacterium]